MKKRTLITGLILALILIIVIPMSITWAQNTGTITCTASVQSIAITLTNGTIDYGAVALNQTKDTTAGPHPTVRNSGTVLENYSIRSSDAIGLVNWQLNSPGSNQFGHSYKVTDGWVPLTTDPVQFLSPQAPNVSQQFDLQISMPTSTTDYGPHTITVTIQASMAQ